ncbi:MAG: hypothetical protein GY720_03540 [bacterium]|nr:hypothetical protein [bacterium]
MTKTKWLNARSAVVGLLVGAMLVTAGPAVASAVAAMMLGQTNAVDSSTRLTGDVTSSNLRIINTSEDGIALRLDVEPGNAPFKVNSSVKVAKLNADRLDGKSAGAFLKKSAYDSDRNGTVDDSQLLDGMDSSDFAASDHDHFSGTTVRGAFNVSYEATGEGDESTAGISFGVTLASAPMVHLLAPAASPTAACPGSSAAPEATTGNLCLYQTESKNVGFTCIAQTGPDYSCGFADPWGTSLYVTSSTTGNTRSLGSWALGVPTIAAEPIAAPTVVPTASGPTPGR